ncbi:uncharacterized protein TEOVI_000204000 [Trypanosoma equiperdum]|uniref:Uncharacterized protein n=2 Tax=Trypanozoon TaxID=39700 RepID=Q38EK3_TRYB2|nr:hypothetical protein, unlikely [Trypanosoma brucei brucei TREU927]EAN76767.1 hypothetical protein, unlikely [Trypanosoma brucei brucei TREU927]SCU70467.1 hypothetical protein, conserved [Trypanosoma equiperdum]
MVGARFFFLNLPTSLSSASSLNRNKITSNRLPTDPSTPQWRDGYKLRKAVDDSSTQSTHRLPIYFCNAQRRVSSHSGRKTLLLATICIYDVGALDSFPIVLLVPLLNFIKSGLNEVDGSADCVDFSEYQCLTAPFPTTFRISLCPRLRFGGQFFFFCTHSRGDKNSRSILSHQRLAKFVPLFHTWYNEQDIS